MISLRVEGGDTMNIIVEERAFIIGAVGTDGDAYTKLNKLVALLENGYKIDFETADIKNEGYPGAVTKIAFSLTAPDK